MSQTRGGRGGKNAPRRPNRAQQRAMEVRAAATTPNAPVGLPLTPAADEATVIDRAVSVGGAAARRAARVRARVVAKPMVISREQEYRYIQADLRRLLVTAGALLVLMLVLLVVLD